jgi:lipid A 3-O-deacylase
MRPSAQLQVDNDLFLIRGTGHPIDYDYTHGTRTVVSMPSNGRIIGAGLAQEIYTPRHNTTAHIPGDRPYAAALYGAVSLTRVRPRGLDSLAIDLGVTGPPALGRELQNGIHRLLHNHLEAGWSRQLPTRLLASASYDAKRFVIAAPVSLPSRFLAAGLGGTLGTVRRAFHVGAESYWGFGSIRAANASTPLVRRPGRWYITASYREDLVLHDAFIEGTGGVSGAARLPWVGEAALGAGLHFSRFAAEYRCVVRAREYRSQPNAHPYGSIRIVALLRGGVPERRERS